MHKLRASRRAGTLSALSLLLGFLALSGWGAFAYAARSAGLAQQLREELANLKSSHDQLIRERDQTKAQLAAAQDAQVRLLAERDQVTVQLTTAQQQLKKLSAMGSVREQAIGNPRLREAKGTPTKPAQKDGANRQVLRPQAPGDVLQQAR